MIHPTAEVSPKAIIGEGTRIWHHAQVRDGAVIGHNCILGKGVFVDVNVRIGDNCKLQNGVYVYRGVTVEEGVFLGPHVMCLNDKNPRSVNPDKSLKTDADWVISGSRICMGAAIGGGAIILPGVDIGKWALVGAGSVVTCDVPDYGMVYGNPAQLRGFVCPCGHKVGPTVTTDGDAVVMRCVRCSTEIRVPTATYQLLGAESNPR